jgi:predicted O-methyltransferase YrrM
MQGLVYNIWSFLRFYWSAVTKYQLHSPFVYELCCAVQDNDRWYYAFEDIEMVRSRMLQSTVMLQMMDYGAGGNCQTREVALKDLAARSASSGEQGRMLFYLLQHLQPTSVLELGTSLGIGTMYMWSGVPSASVVTIEGCLDCAKVAASNFEILEARNIRGVSGSFEEKLQGVLDAMKVVDAVFMDGNHRTEPTLRYFEQILPFAATNTVFIFDDVHQSPEMERAWQQVKENPSVMLTIDFYELSLVFINPDIKTKQHFKVLPAWWKPWLIVNLLK